MHQLQNIKENHWNVSNFTPFRLRKGEDIQIKTFLIKTRWFMSNFKTKQSSKTYCCWEADNAFHLHWHKNDSESISNDVRGSDMAVFDVFAKGISQKISKYEKLGNREKIVKNSGHIRKVQDKITNLWLFLIDNREDYSNSLKLHTVE